MRKSRVFVVEGIPYRSNYEAKQAQRLIDNGITFEYETKILEYVEEFGNGLCLNCGSVAVAKSRIYTPDFYFPETDIFVELKGKFDQDTRRKMKNICTQCEDDIRMVFMRDNWLTRKHSMTYGRWCEINGIVYAVGDIPLEWAR